MSILSSFMNAVDSASSEDKAEPGMVLVKYSANNSGGHWWVDNEAWNRLHESGWAVDRPSLGAVATQCQKNFRSLRDGIDEWERITGCNASDLGCSCCGQPHYFSAHDDTGKWIDSYSPDYLDKDEG